MKTKFLNYLELKMVTCTDESATFLVAGPAPDLLLLPAEGGRPAGHGEYSPLSVHS